ncbi:MAG TPA: CoA pyrophosphatase [Nitrososphaerales archaeon]|nr:CoA pyrophosphatase [Nitrososphaerales archaeon]
MQEDIFAALVTKLGSQEPQTREKRRAAVSVVLSDRGAPKILLIKRSEREGDPWSGQIAFPGGKFQEGDDSLKATAVREAREEVGIDLDLFSEFLGYLGSFKTHTGGMEVVPVVFLLKEQVGVKTNKEATSYMWIDLAKLASGDAKSTYRLDFRDDAREVPAFRVGDYAIWGLTHRIISSLVEGILV